MIEDRIKAIELKVETAPNISNEEKSELLELLSGLKSEVTALSETHHEDARSIARFADASAHEATRTQRKPELVNAALGGLTASVEGLEASHPRIVQIVNRLAAILSNMGI